MSNSIPHAVARGLQIATRTGTGLDRIQGVPAPFLRGFGPFLRCFLRGSGSLPPRLLLDPELALRLLEAAAVPRVDPVTCGARCSSSSHLSKLSRLCCFGRCVSRRRGVQEAELEYVGLGPLRGTQILRSSHIRGCLRSGLPPRSWGPRQPRQARRSEACLTLPGAVNFQILSLEFL